jgi:hypothetical protein
MGRFALLGCTALWLKGLPNGLGSLEERTFEWCRALALSSGPDSIESEGRSGIVFVGGAATVGRNVELGSFHLFVREKVRKSYILDVSGQVEATGPVAVEEH